MPYTVHQAKTNLSRLIKEAESGKEVIITRGKVPVARLVPIESVMPSQHVVLKPDISTEPALEPLSEDELRELGLG
jgi:prevent-host-death family protein